MEFVRQAQHRLSHWLGTNRGDVVTARDERDGLWVGFRCVGCGRISSVDAVVSSRLFDNGLPRHGTQPSDGAFS